MQFYISNIYANLHIFYDKCFVAKTIKQNKCEIIAIFVKTLNTTDYEETFTH